MPTLTRSGIGPVDASASPRARWKTCDLRSVSLKGGFWGERQAINRKVSLRHGFEMLEKAGNLTTLRLAAGLTEGQYRGRSFADSDVYKWLEAAGVGIGQRTGLRTTKHGG